MYKNIHSRLINSLINWQDHSNIVAPYPRPELRVRDGPLFLNAVEFLKFRVNAFELVLQQLPTLVAQLHVKQEKKKQLGAVYMIYVGCNC